MIEQIKTALVTGGTKGIGHGVVLDLIKREYQVILTYSSDDSSAQALKSELGENCDRLFLYKVNHQHKGEILEFCELVKQRFSRIDVLVCNAGISNRTPYVNQSDEDFEDVMQVSLFSHSSIIRELFLHLNKGSRIVFIGSMMAIYPHSVSVAYGVAKAAVHALALNLVKVFEGTMTTINVVAPGFVDTDWQKDKPMEIRQNICNKTAMGRFASVSEIVNAVLFCVDNEFVNGSIIEVSGGYSYK